MSIRLKIIFVVLPLLIASVVLAGMASYFAAASAVTKIAVGALEFKASGLERYADSQWNLLVDNGFTGRPEMEQAARAAVESYARSLLRSPTESVIAVDAQGALGFKVGPAELSPADAPALAALASQGKRGFVAVSLGGVPRVASAVPFAPFRWLMLVTEERRAFYGEVEGIARISLEILVGASLAAVLLLLLLTGYLVRPLKRVVSTMQGITASNDLTQRVAVDYKDEIGQLSHTFNLMLEALDSVNKQVKSYAFDAVVAQKRETKVRNIFQLYVPKDVIDQVFESPEKMLVGNNRDVAVLFSDIRSFTTISERMAPDELVESLNRYFSIMVEAIMARDGIVDKYIGDAIMAVFGAPVSHGNDALASVRAGLDMTDALVSFNADQEARGKPPFHIGVGINFGVVTVGNIGCDKKMNYTVIGDGVNLASRLEGLTKMYHQPLLVSESVKDQIGDAFPCRSVDIVAVKGKTLGVRIYAVARELNSAEAQAWKLHAEALDFYYDRRFGEAAILFSKVLKLLPGDYLAQLFLERAQRFQRQAPAADWAGVEVMTEK